MPLADLQPGRWRCTLCDVPVWHAGTCRTSWRTTTRTTTARGESGTSVGKTGLSIYAHDKMLTLLSRRDGYRAATLYMFSLGWSGEHATDGFIPDRAVAFARHPETRPDAGRCAAVGKATGGYQIRNWEVRQQTATVTELKREIAHKASMKANCIRWHGLDCGCWKTPHDVSDSDPIGDPKRISRRTPTNERTYLRKTGARLMVSNGMVSEMASETEELA